jgi:HEAT repeat protein
MRIAFGRPRIRQNAGLAPSGPGREAIAVHAAGSYSASWVLHVESEAMTQTSAQDSFLRGKTTLLQRGWVLAALLLTIPTAAAGLQAQPTPPPLDAAKVEKLIATLDAKEFKVRQAATRQLIELGLPVRPTLLRALKTKGLSLEMERRLKLIADEILGFQVLKPLRPANGHVTNHLAYYDAMFLIDNQAGWERHHKWLPDLPKVDFAKKLLLVVVSWDGLPRTILGPQEDGDTLVVPVKQVDAQLGDGRERPPQILLAQVIAWSGPVRFELNGRPQFTVYKGKALIEHSLKLWKEIQRLKAGGEPTLAQRIDAARPLWGDGTPDAAIAAAVAKVPVVSRDELKAIFNMEFRRLAEMRATPVVAEMWAMAQTLVEFDPATQGLGEALFAIGGPEVTGGCAKALQSKNRFTQLLAVCVARNLAEPALRPLFHEALTKKYGPVLRGGLDGLDRIGRTKEDVPALIGVLERAEDFAGGNEDVVQTAAWHLGAIGGDAAAALPALKKLQQHANTYHRDAATKAISRIQAAIEAPR